MQAVRGDSSLSQDQKRDKVKQIHETTNSQINDTLTPDQQKKFAALQAQRKEHQGGNKPNPPEEPKRQYADSDLATPVRELTILGCVAAGRFPHSLSHTGEG